MNDRHLALVVDDDHPTIEIAEAILSSLGHDYRAASSQEEAEAMLESEHFCYVLLDLELPARPSDFARRETGFNILERIRLRFTRQELPVIVMTGHGVAHELSVRALKMEANDYIMKPFDQDPEPLDIKIRQVIAKSCEARGKACGLSHAWGRGARVSEGAPAPEPSSARDRRLHFSGECRKRRYRMEIDGREAWVRLGTFELLWRLAAAAMTSPTGWIRGSDMNESYHTALTRLRKDLFEVLGLEVDFLENDGHGSYRLTVGVERISYEADAIRSHHPRLMDLFEGVPISGR